MSQSLQGLPCPCWERIWAPPAQTPGPAAPDAPGGEYSTVLSPWARTAVGPKLHFLWFPDSDPSKPQGQGVPQRGSKGCCNWQQTGCVRSQLDSCRNAAQACVATSSSLHTAQTRLQGSCPSMCSVHATVVSLHWHPISTNCVDSQQIL